MRGAKYVCAVAGAALITPVWSDLGAPVFAKILFTAAAVFFFLFAFAAGFKAEGRTARLRRLRRGADQILAGGISAVLAVVFAVCFVSLSGAGTIGKIVGATVPFIAAGLLVFAGTARAIAGSRQLKIADYASILLFWWAPVANIFVIRKTYKTARREFVVETDRIELDEARASSEICASRYPILLVHGIFFRDWQLVNYWGRIPAALISNGAKIFYAGQQSALSIPDSAAEVARSIEKTLAETGAEKVNVIAHSKGGLDSRYAISRLGMEDRVATLTTINTPHKGCDMVDYLLKKVPAPVVGFIEKRYNRIFSKLGDASPDFLAGVKDLSAEKAKSYDELMPDSPLVSYRSVTSVMSRAGSAGFPLNIGYRLIKKLNGANDGLVWEDSAKRWERYRLITTRRKRGVSHGDVIDLMRENIEGFDVREFYVGLVAELKREGF